MASFPTLTTGIAVMRHPSHITSANNVRVHTFLSDKEQRYRLNNTVTMNLEYRGVASYDLQRVSEFFDQQKGARATAPLNAAMTNYFDITVDGVQYNYMCFDQDAIQWTEETGGKFSFTISMRQLRES